jgi:hypothetical protein
MTFQASGPGLLYVNSKITSPNLSPELFTEWYQDIHIRDIFLTSGIKSAFRYYTQSSEPATIERPYLALYPVKDVAFLYSAEFRAIPVHSDMLPIKSKNIFDLADFDTRYYTNVGILEGEGGSECRSTHNRPITCNIVLILLADPHPLITPVPFDLPSDLKGSSDGEIMKWYASQTSQNSLVRIRMYKLLFARQNRLPQEQNQLQQPQGFLVLVGLPSIASQLQCFTVAIADYSIARVYNRRRTEKVLAIRQPDGRCNFFQAPQSVRKHQARLLRLYVQSTRI